MRRAGSNLPPSVVREAFQYSLEQNAPLCGFLGDTCVTLRMTDELKVGAKLTFLLIILQLVNKGSLALCSLPRLPAKISNTDRVQRRSCTLSIMSRSLGWRLRWRTF